MEKGLLDCDADSELHNEQFLVAERVTAARPGCANGMGHLIEQIIARDTIERPISPATRMPQQPKHKRAKLSQLNVHLTPFRRRINSCDKTIKILPVWPHCRAHLKLDDGDYE